MTHDFDQSNDDYNQNDGIEDMENLYHEVLQKNSVDFLDDSQLSELHNYLKDLKLQLMDEERYLDARDAYEVMKGIQEEMNRRDREQNESKQKQSPDNSFIGKKLSEYVFYFCLFMYTFTIFFLGYGIN